MATLAELEQGLKVAYANGRMDYARILGAEIVKARGDKVNQIPDMQIPGTAPAKTEPSVLDQIGGAGEAALTVATGATGGVVGTAGGFLKGLAQSILDGSFGTREAAQAIEKSAMGGGAALTYAPRSEAGKEAVQAVGEVASMVPPIVGAMGAPSAILPAVAAASLPVTQVAGRAAKAVPAAAKAVAETVQTAMDPARKTAGASMGAAAVPMDMLRRQKAENLPVPVKLTEGAATRDAAKLAFEKEQIKSPTLGAPLRARAEQNNLEQLQNFDVLLDLTGAQSPDLAATGTLLTKTLAKGYEAAKNKTRAAYKKAELAGELAQPVPSKTIVDTLIQSSPAESTAPVLTAARKELIRLGGAAEDQNGMLIANPAGMSLANMEQLRKFINSTTGFDGPNIKFAGDLKRAIDAATDGAGGELYKKARAERTAQARKYENRAIVARLINNKRGTDDVIVPVDEVFRRTVLNSSPEEITFLKRVLKTNGKAGEEAWRELEGETLKYIRDEATKGMGMDSADKPLVSPAKLHNAVSQLEKNGRLDLMLGKKNAQIVRDLNEVVRYINTVPPGTLVNTSGTAGVLMAAIAEAGATGALTGLPLPVISSLKLVGKSVKDARIKSKIKKALGE